MKPRQNTGIAAHIGLNFSVASKMPTKIIQYNSEAQNDFATNQELMKKAKALKLSYKSLYDAMQDIFPLNEGQEYIGSLANHFRGKLKTYKNVDDFIECLSNNSLKQIITHFS